MLLLCDHSIYLTRFTYIWIITHIVLPNSEPYNKLFTTTQDGNLMAETRMVYQKKMLKRCW
jgi:hypothetical protein